jgi:hypothetical protein
MMESEKSPWNDETQVTNISQATVDDVHAQSVRMHQADAENISASDVQLEQSAAGTVKATHVSMHQSAAASVDATEFLAQHSATAMLKAEKASLSGYNGMIVAGTADVRNSINGLVVGNEVHVGESSRTILLVGQNIHGNVTTLMNTRSALIAGLLAGLFGGLMLLLGETLFRRK